MVITSRTDESRPAHRLEIKIDTGRNEPDVLADEKGVAWDSPHATGTKVKLDLDLPPYGRLP